MMVSMYLKDSVITTQSITIIEDLKPKSEKKKVKIFSKNVVFCTLVSRNSIVELVSKEIAFPVQCCPKQTKLERRKFLKWASIALTESCVTYLPSDCWS